MNNNQNKLDIKALETWLWDAARKLHGPIDVLSKYRLGPDDVKPNTLFIEDAVVLLQEAEEERQKADEKMKAISEELGVGELHRKRRNHQPHMPC